MWRPLADDGNKNLINAVSYRVCVYGDATYGVKVTNRFERRNLLSEHHIPDVCACV